MLRINTNEGHRTWVRQANTPMFPRSQILWITTVCERRILHATFVRFAFVRFMPLLECITMHYSNPRAVVITWYNPIFHFHKELLLVILMAGKLPCERTLPHTWKELHLIVISFLAHWLKSYYANWSICERDSICGPSHWRLLGPWNHSPLRSVGTMQMPFASFDPTLEIQ